MTTTKYRTWRVEGTLPTEGGGRTYKRNVNLIVYALTLEEAVASVREKYGDITFIKVMGDRWADDVLVVEPESGEQPMNPKGTDL
jgi:hypothetical protein